MLQTVDLDLLLELPFEPFAIDQAIDSRRYFPYPLDPDFPFSVRLLTFSPAPPPYPLNWHERLEIFVPLEGRGVFAMGSEHVRFAPGDILVVDNLALHAIVEFRGPRRTAMTVYFMPRLVCGPGALPCDAMLLNPFHRPPGCGSPIVRTGDACAPVLHRFLQRLARCYLEGAGDPLAQARCKTYLLEVLCVLASRADWNQTHVEAPGTREARRIRQLHEYLLEHYAEKISLSMAASIAGMSKSNFLRYFKRVTGQTLVPYLNRLRLEKSLNLLKTTELSIAEIAAAVGFSDQSYFDKTFRRHFHQNPREARKSFSSASGREV